MFLIKRCVCSDSIEDPLTAQIQKLLPEYFSLVHIQEQDSYSFMLERQRTATGEVMLVKASNSLKDIIKEASVNTQKMLRINVLFS